MEQTDGPTNVQTDGRTQLLIEMLVASEKKPDDDKIEKRMNERRTNQMSNQTDQ